MPGSGGAPDWWRNTGQTDLERPDDGDDIAVYYHDVSPELAAEAIRRSRNHPSERAYEQRWPLDAWPDVATRVLICGDDRLFPATWMRGLVRDRLGIDAGDEIPSGHCPMLSVPDELADRLVAIATGG